MISQIIVLYLVVYFILSGNVITVEPLSLGHANNALACVFKLENGPAVSLVGHTLWAYKLNHFPWGGAHQLEIISVSLERVPMGHFYNLVPA